MPVGKVWAHIWMSDKFEPLTVATVYLGACLCAIITIDQGLYWDLSNQVIDCFVSICGENSLEALNVLWIWQVEPPSRAKNYWVALIASAACRNYNLF